MSSTTAIRPVALSAADLTGCRALTQRTTDDVQAEFARVITAAGANIVRTVSHVYPGDAVTCVLILQESHAILHTWPEAGVVHVDIFACSTSVKAEQAIQELGAFFEAARIKTRALPRATGDPAPERLSIRRPAMAFAVRALLLSVGLFGLLRLPWVEQQLLWPFTSLQANLAALGGGGQKAIAQVGLSCSGTDVIALCLSVIAAWPTGWRARFGGAIGGIGVIVAVNVVRIMTLVRVDDTSRAFTFLHEYVWPVALTLVVAGYVLAWTTWVDRVERQRPPADLASGSGWTPLARFSLATVVCVAAFLGAAPLYLHAAPVVALATWMAQSAATVLGWCGVHATTSGAVLLTARGAFQVTGECIATPVFPVTAAAALTLPRSWRGSTAALVAVGPLFVALGIARLLVLALPTVVPGEPQFWAHAFFQLMTAGVAVAAVVAWRGAWRATDWYVAAVRAAGGILAGVFVAVLLGLRYANAIDAAAVRILGIVHGDAGFLSSAIADPQGALALLPAFQLGLLIALWVGLRNRAGSTRWAAALLALVISQIVLFAGLRELIVAGLQVPVPWLRAWAVAAPLMLALVAHRLGSAETEDAYRPFWEAVGARFPDLGGAASTDYYFENEKRLIAGALPTLRGCRILKTDLWDEAKNTRILQWAASQGAVVFGVDLSQPTVRQARDQFVDAPVGATAADVRYLPFVDATFDAVYSMGTIEHFPDSDVSVREMYRVLKPGGRVILGVPNRWDPFLRPLQAWIMQRLGVYAYGAERSFSRPALRRLIEAEGFHVVDETGILFIPGWLRMLDLAAHCWWRPLARVTGALVAPFVFIDRRVRWIRRHGYLLATVAIKQATDPS